MFKFIIYALMIYFLIRFLINFLFPVLRFRRSAKTRFQEMNDFFQQQQQQQGFQSRAQNKKPKKESPKIEGEYIDFEEIK